jgi:GntR family transcriptional regulator/MocR family aminotransferase
MHLAVTLPEGMDDRGVSLQAALEKLWLWPLSSAYLETPERQGFILGFGGTEAVEMPNAVRRLKNVLAAASGWS